MVGGGLPSGVLALRAATLRLRDPHGLLTEALVHLERSGTVAVIGAPATGRSRLIREIAAATGCDVVAPLSREPLDAALARRHALRAATTPSVIGVPVRGTYQVTAVARRWRTAGIPVVTTRPLPRAALAAIACELLDARRVPATVDPMIDLASGRPGDLIDLLLGSRETGAMVFGSGGWVLDGPVSLDRVSTDVLQHRRALDESQRTTLDTVAVAGAIPIRMGAPLIAPPAIARLHRAGLLVTRRLAGTVHVTMDRPVDAAVVNRALEPQALQEVRDRLRHVVTRRSLAVRPDASFVQGIETWTDMIDWLFEIGTARSAPAARAEPVPEDLGAILRDAAAPVRDLDLTPIDGIRRPPGSPQSSSVITQVRKAAAAMLAIQTGPLDALEISAGTRRRDAERTDDVVGAYVWSDVEAAIAEASGLRWVARGVLASAEAFATRIAVPGLLGEVIARRAMVAAEIGRLTRAEDELERARSFSMDDERTSIRLGVAEALILSVTHLDRAVDRAIRAGEEAVEMRHFDLAIQSVIVPARLGVINAAATPLLREVVEGRCFPVGSAHVRHLDALAEGDADDLADVGISYVSLGRRLLAAETFAAAARRAGPAAQALLRRRAAGLLMSCPGAWTVGVADLEPWRTQIEDDDRRIAAAATSGATNAEIAQQLAISPRTVETRLTRLFRQFGVTSRRELAAMHAPLFQAGRHRARGR